MTTLESSEPMIGCNSITKYISDLANLPSPTCGRSSMLRRNIVNDGTCTPYPRIIAHSTDDVHTLNTMEI
ncbi:hypothetical protein ACN47E_002651 [Coniothyrium glycines]